MLVMNTRSVLVTAVTAVMFLSGLQGAVAQDVSQDDFSKLLAESKESREEEEKQNELAVIDIDPAQIFRDIDSNELRLRRLKQAILIAEAENKLRELTGLSGVATEKEQEIKEKKIRDLESELVGLRSELALIQQSKEVQSAERVGVVNDWIVKSISISEKMKSAVISGLGDETFRVVEGDKIDGVTIASIGSYEVIAIEQGKKHSLPVASIDAVARRGVPDVGQMGYSPMVPSEVGPMMEFTPHQDSTY